MLQRGIVLSITIHNTLSGSSRLLIMMMHSQHLYPVILEICFKIILKRVRGAK